MNTAMLRSRQGLQLLNVWGSLRCWDTRRVRLLVVDLRLWHGLGEVHGDQCFFFFSTLTMLQAWLFLTLCYFLQI